MAFVLILMLPGQTVMGSDPTEKAGDYLMALMPTLALGSTLYLDDSDGSKQFLKGFATNYAVTWGLKKAISKTRPNGRDDDSFPSGHTSVVFQSAAFINRRYGSKYGIPAYLGAAYVAWSRVEADEHFLVDVVAGAAIGIGSSLIFTRPYKGFVITPMAGIGFYGIGISRSW